MPGLAVSGAFLLVVASVFAFVFLVHHVSHSIRAVSIMEAVAAETRAAIRENLPADGDEPVLASTPMGPPTQVILFERGPGALLGVDEDDLILIAAKHDCTLELLPTVGDYLPSNVPVFAVHGGDGSVDADEVLRHVGIGPERTMLPGHRVRLAPARRHGREGALACHQRSDDCCADASTGCTICSVGSPSGPSRAVTDGDAVEPAPSHRPPADLGGLRRTWPSTRSGTSASVRCRSLAGCGPPSKTSSRLRRRTARPCSTSSCAALDAAVRQRVRRRRRKDDGVGGRRPGLAVKGQNRR